MAARSTLRLGLVGFAGRMGQTVLQALAAPEAGCTLGGILLHRTSAPERLAHLAFVDAAAFVATSDVVLDFSAPSAATTLAPLCAAAGRAYVVASTGLEQAQVVALEAAARHVAVLQAANMSLGVNVLMELVELAARRLGPAADVEIIEVHHRHKRDAPSGTALALGRAASAGIGAAEGASLVDVISRTSPAQARQSGQVGYAAVRGGDVAGEHTVLFLADGERLELTHRSGSRTIFAAGALHACRWSVTQSPGLYSMRDVVRDGAGRLVSA